MEKNNWLEIGYIGIVGRAGGHPSITYIVVDELKSRMRGLGDNEILNNIRLERIKNQGIKIYIRGNKSIMEICYLCEKLKSLIEHYNEKKGKQGGVYKITLEYRSLSELITESGKSEDKIRELEREISGLNEQRDKEIIYYTEKLEEAYVKNKKLEETISRWGLQTNAKEGGLEKALYNNIEKFNSCNNLLFEEYFNKISDKLSHLKSLEDLGVDVAEVEKAKEIINKTKNFMEKYNKDDQNKDVYSFLDEMIKYSPTDLKRSLLELKEKVKEAERTISNYNKVLESRKEEENIEVPIKAIIDEENLEVVLPIKLKEPKNKLTKEVYEFLKKYEIEINLENKNVDNTEYLSFRTKRTRFNTLIEDLQKNVNQYYPNLKFKAFLLYNPKIELVSYEKQLYEKPFSQSEIRARVEGKRLKVKRNLKDIVNERIPPNITVKGLCERCGLYTTFIYDYTEGRRVKIRPELLDKFGKIAAALNLSPDEFLNELFIL